MSQLYKRQIKPMHYSPGGQGFSDTCDPIIYKGEEWHDESEIEEIKKALEPVIREKDSWGSLKFDERFVPVDNGNMAIDTMHKYQKIEKIVNNTFQNIAKEDERYAYEWLGDIKEVLEDGNED